MWLLVAAIVTGVIAATALIMRDSEVQDAATTAAPALGDLAGSAPSVNDAAPGFDIPTLDGARFSLVEHLAADGRPVFLNLWASWCFPCREEMPAIDAAAKRHPDVAFVGVSVRDNRGDAETFATEIGVSYTIGFDEDDQVADGYPALGMPATFLISSEGVVVDVVYGGVTADAIDDLVAEAFSL